MVVSCFLALLAGCQSSATSSAACEANVATDLDNCGQCGTHCPAIINGLAACVGGACGVGACTAPFLDCNRVLTDGCEASSSRDPEHCGDCDTRCAAAANASPLCSGGKCKFTCNAPFLDCNSDPKDGCEINTATDVDNCGSCGSKCPSGPHGTPACANGVCGFSLCAAPFQTCGPAASDSCATNTSNDVNNCAACGHKCPEVAHATPACSSGACGIGSCSTTYRDCNSAPADGCEVDTATNPLHCGGCGARCDLPNAAASCTASTCAIASCVEAYKDCNGTVADGCEVNSAADPNNCGGCATKCPAVPNGTPGCAVGVCGLGSCNASFKDCNGTVADGCEVDTSADVFNCGGCATKCPMPANADSASCTAGSCRFTCLTGFADCDGSPTNGCEVSLTADVSHCGSCTNACGLKPNTIASSCAGSTCGYTCASGFGDCNGKPADGCEINLASDLGNCGSCGARCSIAGGTGGCSSGTCSLLTCTSPFRDCNKTPTDGCEVNSAIDPNNCGGCSIKCPAVANGTPGCAAGVCGIGSCNTSFKDCNGAVADGCEVDTAGDVSNCGGCGTKCPTPANASASCAAGSCQYTCLAGFADCDGLATNGCEVSLGTDVSHCGTCTNACGLKPNTVASSCAGSTCGYTCASGFADCNGKAADGCEVNLATDLSNCGSCGASCSIAGGTGTCSSGTCSVLTCTNPFRDCNMSAADGCEANSSNDPNNCGVCSNVCPARPSTSATVCVASTCGFTCSTGYADCNAKPVDGCEINTTNDPKNCGACGSTCGFFDWCANSRCCTFGIYC